jgi:membrane-bound serine protease (ClpP class)
MRPTSRRATATALMRHVLGIVAATAILGLVAFAPAHATAAPASVWVATADGAITPPLAAYLEKVIRDAQADGAGVVVIEMDTPGGLDTSMRRIIQAEIASTVPVVVFVYPQGARSASAGVYIMMGADVTAMAPQTNLGSAHPVALNGSMDATMEAKVTNDAAAYMKGLSTTHERNATWAEKAVRESVSLTAEEAKAADVIEFVAVDLADLLRQLDGYTTVPKGITLHTAGAPVVQVPMTWRDRLLHAVVDPNIAFILLLLGIYGLIFEFQSPGLGISGVAGAIALLVALYAMQVLPVSYVGLALIVVAMVLYVAEVKIQSHGALGFAGTVALILGGLLLFDVPGSFGSVSWVVIGIAAALSFAFFAVVISAVSRARGRPSTTGREGMTGEIGVARTRLDPSGQVLVHGELWKAQTDDGVIGSGDTVEVVGMDGLELHVRRRTAAETGADKAPSDTTAEAPR